MVNSGSSINSQAFNRVQNILSSVTCFFQRLILRKDIHSLNADSHSEHILRPRALKLFHLVGIGLGGTIGKIRIVFSWSLSSIGHSLIAFRHRDFRLHWPCRRPLCWSFGDHCVHSCWYRCTSSSLFLLGTGFTHYHPRFSIHLRLRRSVPSISGFLALTHLFLSIDSARR